VSDVWDVGLVRLSRVSHDVAHFGSEHSLLAVWNVGLLAAVGFLADWVKLQFQGIDEVLLGDLAEVGDNVGG